MAPIRVLAGCVIVTALAAGPLSADQGRRRPNAERGRERAAEGAERGGQRAVPRSRGIDRQNEQRQAQSQRQAQVQRQQQIQRESAARQYQAQRQYEARRRYDTARRYDNRRDYGRPGYSSRAYGYGRAVPRIVRPRIVTVIPYRPYVYRPRLGIGIYYGAGGAYPYGYTPRGYYDPIPGRAYGGLRITGAPHEAHVFADGYYVGIVDDFDGIFQHLNLEAGPHRIEVEVPGYEPIAFDVLVQPGRTTTFRADF